MLYFSRFTQLFRTQKKIPKKVDISFLDLNFIISWPESLRAIDSRNSDLERLGSWMWFELDLERDISFGFVRQTIECFFSLSCFVLIVKPNYIKRNQKRSLKDPHQRNSCLIFRDIFHCIKFNPDVSEKDKIFCGWVWILLKLKLIVDELFIDTYCKCVGFIGLCLC